jgi:MFS transporter, AAHS family, 3-hydroxyphenylpropionic acid transporter
MPLGGGLSALVTQLLPPDFDWRLLFQIGGILPLLLVPAILAFMQETYRPGSRAGGAGASVPAMRALFGDGRATTTLLLWAMFLPTMLILYLILNWLPTLVAAKGLDRSIAPLASLWFNLASVVGGLALSPLVDRIGYRWPVTLAFAGLIFALIGLAGATSIGTILLLSGLAGFFLLGANYSFYGVAAACYPTEMRGTGSGASVAVGRIGSVFGPLLAGLLMGQGTSAGSVILYLAPCAAIAGLAVFALSYVVPRGRG